MRTLDQIVQTAHKKGKWVSVCGEMTSDPHAVPLLVALGVDSLSVSPRMYLRIKQVVRGLRFANLQKIVPRALAASDSDQIKKLLADQGL